MVKQITKCLLQFDVGDIVSITYTTENDTVFWAGNVIHILADILDEKVLENVAITSYEISKLHKR